MKYPITGDDLITVTLTNEREGSTGAYYLVDGRGREYGPADVVPAQDPEAHGEEAGTLVFGWSYGQRNAAARAAANAYLRVEEFRLQERATRPARLRDAITRLRVARNARDRTAWDEAWDEINTIRQCRADEVVADLVEAEQAVAERAPAILERLDAIARAHAEDRDTWLADLRCGDLPDQDASEAAVSDSKKAWARMAHVFYGNDPVWVRGNGAKARRAVNRLARVVRRLKHLALRNDDMAEYIADSLGERGPRYEMGH